MSEIIFKRESFEVIGICMKIHTALGMGLKEINYKDAMEIDFIENEMPYEREKKFDVFYKSIKLKNPYYADFMVFDSIILEIKSCPSIVEAHIAQALSYLAVSGKKLALIINFGEKSLTYKSVLL